MFYQINICYGPRSCSCLCICVSGVSVDIKNETTANNWPIKIVSQLAPSIYNILSDIKTIWTTLNELRWPKTKIERHKDTKTEDRKKER